MTIYLLIAGSYHGGWCWSRVARLLRESGHDVHTPTLTGLGERAHLPRPDIGLETYINDIVQVMNYMDLHDVTIVSHSYGGVVAGGAVDRMPGRFARAVYFDALVPRDGASVVDLLPDEYQPYFTTRITADGRAVTERATLRGRPRAIR
jgi:pimeloyl-ACP methyl ester carboxylesterase